VLSHGGVHVQLRILVAAGKCNDLEDSQEHRAMRLNQAGGEAFRGTQSRSATHGVECGQASAIRGFEG